MVFQMLNNDRIRIGTVPASWIELFEFPVIQSCDRSEAELFEILVNIAIVKQSYLRDNIKYTTTLN